MAPPRKGMLLRPAPIYRPLGFRKATQQYKVDPPQAYDKELRNEQNGLLNIVHRSFVNDERAIGLLR